MGTVAQNEANRRNAKRSTGPKTESGKSVARKNAITHGLTSTHVVIRGEDQGEFEELRKNLEEEIEPVGVQEFDLVETIAICMWRRRRIYRMETDILNFERTENEHEFAERDYKERQRELERLYEKYGLYFDEDDGSAEFEDGEEDGEVCANWKDGLDEETRKAVEEAESLFETAKSRFDSFDNELEALPTRIGAFFLYGSKYPDALEKVLRYEAAIERSLTKARDQLARLQRDREERAAARAEVIEAIVC